MDAVHTRLLVEGYAKRVSDAYSYGLWRNAALSMLRIHSSKPVADDSLPLVYTPGMANPLVDIMSALEQKEKDENTNDNQPSPGIYQLLLAAEKLNLEDTNGDEKAPAGNALLNAKRKKARTVSAKNAKRNHPPAGPGLSEEELNRLIAMERTTTFNEGFWRVTAVHASGIGKFVEVLRVYENGNTGCWSLWTPARIISFDSAAHVLVVDPYALDDFFGGDEKFYLTYDTEKYAVRPIVFNYDAHYTDAAPGRKFEPQIHYCIHFTDRDSFRVKTHQMVTHKDNGHSSCYRRVLNERALHVKDVVFEKDSK